MKFARKQSGNVTLSGVLLFLVILSGSYFLLYVEAAKQDASFAELSAKLDTPPVDSPFNENAANIAEKQPDLKAHPGLWLQRQKLKETTLEEQLLLTDKGTFRTSLKIFKGDGAEETPLLTKTAEGKYHIKGSTLVFTDITGAKGLFYQSGRQPVLHWDDTQIVVPSESNRAETYKRVAAPTFTVAMTTSR